MGVVEDWLAEEVLEQRFAFAQARTQLLHQPIPTHTENHTQSITTPHFNQMKERDREREREREPATLLIELQA